jgi:hypothetical protein
MKTALLACLTLASLASPLALAQPSQSLQPSSRVGQLVEAVWKVQSFNFVFGGYTTSYSCNSLGRRVHSVLTSIGVLDSLRVYMVDCTDLAGGARMRITLASPVEATPENVRALTTHDTRDVLVAKLRNEQLDTAADLERFPATWTQVSLNRTVRPRLEAGDCELIRQLRRDVLPRLSVQVTREDLHCSVGSLGRFTPPKLTVTALIADRT